MAEVDDDPSASTARFRAFAQSRDDDLPPPWKMRAPGRRIALLAAIVVLVAVVVALLAKVAVG